jgi:hypothetical protein
MSSRSKALLHPSLRPWVARVNGNAISAAAITLYTGTFFLSANLGLSGWRPYALMALFALIPIIVGPRVYRCAGAIALLIAVDAGISRFVKSSEADG